MKNPSISLRKAGTGFLLAALCLGVFSSCKDEDVTATPLNVTGGELYNSTVSSLTFTWEKVPNATQYGYRLLSPAGEVVDGGVTSGVTATFSGLKDNTTYTLELWAYSAYGSNEYCKSTPVTLTGTTPKITPLAAPDVTVSSEDGIVVSWAAIDGAESYSYCYYPADDPGKAVEGETDYTSLKLSMLDPGEYEFRIKAVSGEEAYSDSEYAKTTFTAVKEKRWEAGGVFSPLEDGAECWNATIEGWSDGSYIIRNWYNVEGYDLEFTVDSWGIMTITNADSYGYVASGRQGNTADICTYTAYYNGYYSYFSGNKDSGDLYFYNYETEGFSTFVWPASTGDDSFSIDDLVGTYSQSSTGSQIFDGANWIDFTSTNDVTIAKIDENTVSVTGLMYEDSSLKATFDAVAKTLTFEPQSWLDWYVFCAYDAPTTPVVATVAGNTVSMSGWTAYYTEYSYSYVYGAGTTLTRK